MRTSVAELPAAIPPRRQEEELRAGTHRAFVSLSLVAARRKSVVSPSRSSVPFAIKFLPFVPVLVPDEFATRVLSSSAVTDADSVSPMMTRARHRAGDHIRERERGRERDDGEERF